jgi:hypothetical protein
MEKRILVSGPTEIIINSQGSCTIEIRPIDQECNGGESISREQPRYGQDVFDAAVRSAVFPHTDEFAERLDLIATRVHLQP